MRRRWSLTTSAGFVRAVLPASDRLDLGKLREILGRKDVEQATEAVLAGAYAEFEVGAVPQLTGGLLHRLLTALLLLRLVGRCAGRLPVRSRRLRRLSH